MRRRLLTWLYGLAYPLARVWWRLRAPVRVGVRAVVLDSAGRVLLVRHAYGAEGWAFPGGGPRRRERLAETALREIEEETGVRCRVERLLGVYDTFVEGKSDHVVLFLCRADLHSEPAARSAEIVRVGFFPLDALPTDVSDSTRRRLQEMATGQAAWGLW